MVTAIAAELVAFENFAIGTLFKDVSFLSANQTKLEGESQQYHYRAYLYALLNASSAAKKYHLSVAGWVKDEAGKFDNVAVAAVARCVMVLLLSPGGK